MKQTINLLCATDHNYAAYCGIMLTSALINNRMSHLGIYILSSGLTEDDIMKFKALEQKYDCGINVITPDPAIFKDCVIRTGDHVSVATYYRIALGELLPDEISKIIYLDCDLIVDTSLIELWNMDLGGAPMGVVEDACQVAHNERLNLKGTYFNAGVLLIDVSAFRKEHLSKVCFEMMATEPDRIKFHDQDLLNLALSHRVRHLDVRWNMMTAFLRVDKGGNELSEEFCQKIADTVRIGKMIIHFEYFPKPWHKWIILPHPYVKRWMQYRRMSDWKDAKLITEAPLSFKMKVMLLRTLWRLGLKRKPEVYIV